VGNDVTWGLPSAGAGSGPPRNRDRVVQSRPLSDVCRRKWVGASPAAARSVIVVNGTSSLRSTPKMRGDFSLPGFPCQPGWLPGLIARPGSRPGAFSDAKANACDGAVITLPSKTPLKGAVSVSGSERISSPLEATSEIATVSGEAVVLWSGSITRM